MAGNIVTCHWTFETSESINRLICGLGSDVKLIVHTAAQPSHDWAARDPHVDFHVNAVGTLNLLEATRKHAPEAVFIFTSTNKVYGDLPNRLPLVEQELRFEIDPDHPYATGIREDMSIDQSMHSLFGASKIAADVLVQEYGRYFGLRTACFRGGCLTGPNHSGAQLHGFLSYLMKCAMTGTCYTVFGYKGKQVRDNIHSADLIAAFREFFLAPRVGEVYNIGGGRFSNCSSPRGDRHVRDVERARDEVAVPMIATGPGTTSGGSAIRRSSSDTTRIGGCNTLFRGSSRRSGMRTWAGGARQKPLATEPQSPFCRGRSRRGPECLVRMASD